MTEQAQPIYKRVLVKVSGEALMGPQGFGLHQPTVEAIAADIAATQALGVEVGVVVGGGNIFRGVQVSSQGVDRATGDYMGMLATVMNALALSAAIMRRGTQARVLSALDMPAVCETYTRPRALAHLDRQRVVLFAAGTGNPFFTTDTAAALRAVETGCEALLKATQVDGIYTADPKKDPTATRLDRLTHDEVLQRDLKVMDAAAFALARENALPVIVFSIHEPGSIPAVVCGGGRATTVAS
ncbi:uridylate kinase [Methylopila jiangsuensis]|uniref:Uridylate kinase n=1 Tax=Methylopila jiangsuensis TaxID=586230 RepID=A0A9W6JFA6_9HYPH|nr:UMP kinase [Methylopila jiangsuensis]MDR6285621.1 uridylate kinase [Methylopila jiangsuensis]GLK75381.1 uridylate kinase [Methylopila jiangsuensis]